MIPFNKPFIPPKAIDYISQAFTSGHLAGDHDFTFKCNNYLEKISGANKVLLTTSCTHALELAAILINIEAGDEVIMPSYTFPSTANAFILRGAKIIFVDVKPETMNIDENLIEQAITEKTRAIVPVHYAGIACEMDKIINLAKKYNLYVIEDAAQCLMATYKGKMLGTIGDIGCYSFHETKPFHCGEGGAILLNNEKFISRAEIIREKGTNRSQFFRGEIAKYNWQDLGSSYLPSDLNAALLYSQLEMASKITNNRLESWNYYYEKLEPLEQQDFLTLPKLTKESKHCAMSFYVKLKNHTQATLLRKHLKTNLIEAFIHYVPLHSTPAGIRYGQFTGTDNFTTRESTKLLRLPLYYQLTKREIDYICSKIYSFFSNHNSENRKKYGFQHHLSPEFPSQIVVDITEDCNLECLHCPRINYVNEGILKGRHMDLEIHKKLIDEVGTDGKDICKYLRYTAQGEPLLHPQLVEMIKYASANSNTSINITTNGTLLNEAIAKELLLAGVDVFDFSIDAFSPEVYTKIRKHGDLYITRKNVLTLLKLIKQGNYKTKVVVSFVEQPLNKHETEDFENYWRDTGADYVVIRRMHSCAGSIIEKAEQMWTQNQTRKPCLYPWERLVINPEGYVGFCPADWEYNAKIDSFKNRTIKEIWQGEHMQKLRQAHLDNDFTDHAFCKQCPDWSAMRWPHEGRAYYNMMEEFNETE